MPGGRLTQEDRRRIAAGLAEGLSHAELGRRLSRPTSTITREVNRNRGAAGYQADQAQRATRQRAHRHPAAPAPTAPPADPQVPGRDPAAVSEFEQRFTETLAQMGMPRMIARVLTCLTTADSGAMTSAELVRRLGVSAASVSKAIAFLEGQHLVRRERDGRRERYVVDDDVWYRASVATAEANFAFADAALAGAEALGPDTPAGARLADSGRFLRYLSEDLVRHVEYWHTAITGRGPAEPAGPAAPAGPAGPAEPS
ncbi:MAG TPA: helix-turn-helix domain-containing protein [Streptosporangiaceae bacterium]|nr:helix-turn-helix domain-containing protein [Streptosporangiaceae bacterium]